MMDSLQTLASVFSRRFVFNALLPTIVFGSLTSGTIAYSFIGLEVFSNWWSDLDFFSKVLTVLAYAALMWFLGAAVSSQWRDIVRLFEGYQLRAMAKRLKVRLPGIAWHNQQAEALWSDATRSEEAFYYYPRERNERVQLLPTRLGNILLASERYPAERYGVESIIFWPRLFPLLPERFQRDYESFLTNQEFPLVVSFEAVIATAISSVALLMTGQAPILFAAVFFGGMAFAYAAYRLALAPSVELGEQTRSAYDLHRRLLLEVWPAEIDIRAERATFRGLFNFVVRGAPVRYRKARGGKRITDADTGGSEQR